MVKAFDIVVESYDYGNIYMDCECLISSIGKVFKERTIQHLRIWRDLFRSRTYMLEGNTRMKVRLGTSRAISSFLETAHK